MTNAFGVNDDRVSKSVATGLKMVGQAGKMPSRSAMFGAKKVPETKKLGALYRDQLNEHLKYNLKKPS